MTDTILIRIPNFQKWQKPTDNRREWFALDADFFFDRRVREARRICADAPDCFLSLWREVDENGEVEITFDALKSYWKEIVCSTSNNFDAKKRLNALLKVGLIEVEHDSNSVLNEFKTNPNELQTSFKHDSTEVLSESKDTLEPAETPVALSKNKQTNKQTNNTPLPPKEITFPKSPAGELVQYLHDLLKARGMTKTFLNQHWVEIGVREANILLATETPPTIKAAIDWFSQDAWWRDKLNRMSHVRKHWNQVRFPMAAEPPKQKSRIDQLLSAQAIINRFDPTIIIPVSDIERDSFDQIYWKGRQLVESEYKPYLEAV